MAKILIVDDENNIRLMLRLALRAEGHETTAAADGVEALELFGDGGQFDLVLLDQRMPGMEGLEVLRALKKREAGVKVVMATAFGTVDLAREAMEAGAIGFLRKPFTTDVLRAAVATALKGQTTVRTDNDHFDAVSVNGFRLETTGDESSISRHEFNIQAPNVPPTHCVVELPPFFIELVKAHADLENLEDDTDFWRWLSEEALANYLWQNAAPPEGGLLIVDELTSNLTRWMDAVLAS
jgi:two-component system response regulator (stage 0 sporulation protein F)